MYKISITQIREHIAYLERVNDILTERISNSDFDPELTAIIDANRITIARTMEQFNLTKDEEGRIS